MLTSGLMTSLLLMTSCFFTGSVSGQAEFTVTPAEVKTSVTESLEMRCGVDVYSPSATTSSMTSSDELTTLSMTSSGQLVGRSVRDDSTQNESNRGTSHGAVRQVVNITISR